MERFYNLALCFPIGMRLSGKTRKDGFKVTHIESGRVFKTVNYTEDNTKNNKPWTFSLSVLFALLILVAVFWIVTTMVGVVAHNFFIFLFSSASYHFEEKFIFGYFFIGLGFVLIFLLLWGRDDSKKAEGAICLKYHACEHKVIACIVNRLPATLETLKSMPKACMGCGASMLVMLAMLFILSGVVFFASDAVIGFIYVIFSASFLSILVVFVLTPHVYPSGVHSNHSIKFNILLLGALLLSLPIWSLPLLLDKLIFTAEPPDEILQEGVEITQRIYNDLGITPQN